MLGLCPVINKLKTIQASVLRLEKWLHHGFFPLPSASLPKGSGNKSQFLSDWFGDISFQFIIAFCLREKVLLIKVFFFLIVTFVITKPGWLGQTAHEPRVALNPALAKAYFELPEGSGKRMKHWHCYVSPAHQHSGLSCYTKPMLSLPSPLKSHPLSSGGFFTAFPVPNSVRAGLCTPALAFPSYPAQPSFPSPTRMSNPRCDYTQYRGPSQSPSPPGCLFLKT